ncbi:MAG: site-specific integrase [Candidatus Methanoperedens sp.]|nr:site-specific integrase [Candidatus Methanoperedens sp.]
MKSISQFLELYPSRNSKNVYRAGIHSFLEFIYGSKRNGPKSTQAELKVLDDLSIKYLKDNRDYEEDLLKFAVALHSKPPKSGKAYMAGLKEWLSYNDIELSLKSAKLIRRKMPKGGARSLEADLDTITFRNILQHTDLKGRAFFLTLSSSGIRVGEALQITLNDIDLTKEPVLLNIRQEYTKTNEPRQTYISKEAREVVKEWLKVRNKYIESSMNRNRGLVGNGIGTTKQADDNRIFPFSSNVAEAMWITAIRNAGLLSVDKSTNRKTFRIHQLRKFFRSQLALSCPLDIVETLMGHEGYLTESYRRYTRVQIAEYYLKHESLLHIHKSEDAIKIQGEVAELTGKNQTMDAEVKALRDLVDEEFKTNQQLRDDVKMLKDQLFMVLQELHS